MEKLELREKAGDEDVEDLREGLNVLTKQLQSWSHDPDLIQYHARDLAFRIGDLVVGIFCSELEL
jgi:hypothetical protein